jgi:hypothetical protein
MKNSIKVLNTLLFIFVTIGNLHAQTDSLRVSKKGVFGSYLSVDWGNGDFVELNAALGQNNFPSILTFTGISIGITTRPVEKDSYFSGELFLFNGIPSDVGLESKKTEMVIWGIYDAWHPDVLKNKNWRIGPDFGFGVEVLQLKISEIIVQHNSFSASVNSMPATSVAERKYNGGSVFVKGGISIETKFSIDNVNLYFGTGAAYRLSTNAEFYEKNQTYTDTPKASFTGLELNFRLRMEIFPPKQKRQPEPFKKFH